MRERRARQTDGKRGPIRRFLLGSGEPRTGPDATWWGLGTVISLVAGIGGLVQGIWEAAVFLPVAAWAAIMTARRARERYW
jgi:hypothetical protein